MLVPRTEPFDAALDPAAWDYPVVVKPRTGSGSRDISVVLSSQELAGMARSADFIVQEYLPGEEYSIDVLADAAGHVMASVPRLRAGLTRVSEWPAGPCTTPGWSTSAPWWSPSPG